MRTARWLAWGLLVGASACKSEPAEPAPSPAPAAADQAEPDAEDPAPAEPDAEAVPPKDPPSAEAADSTKSGGLAQLTRELIDKARATTAEPLRLVPDVASFVMQVQIPAVRAYPEAERLWQMVEDKEAGFRVAMDVIRRCMGSLEAVETVAFGFDADENLVLAARGPDLGTETMWRCFDREARALDEDLDLEVTGIPPGEGPQLRENDKPPDEADHGYFADRNTFVLVTREWDADVRALLEGDGTPAIDGRLRASAERIEPDSPVFIVGVWEGKAKDGLSGALSGIEDMALHLRVEDEALVTHLSTDAGTRSDATRVRDDLTREWDGFKAFLPALGLPTSVTSKVEFVAEGDVVSLDLTLTRSEIEAFRTAIEGMI